MWLAAEQAVDGDGEARDDKADDRDRRPPRSGRRRWRSSSGARDRPARLRARGSHLHRRSVVDRAAVGQAARRRSIRSGSSSSRCPATWTHRVAAYDGADESTTNSGHAARTSVVPSARVHNGPGNGPGKGGERRHLALGRGDRHRRPARRRLRLLTRLPYERDGDLVEPVPERHQSPLGPLGERRQHQRCHHRPVEVRRELHDDRTAHALRRRDRQDRLVGRDAQVLDSDLEPVARRCSSTSVRSCCSSGFSSS